MSKKYDSQVFKQLGEDVMPIVAFYAFPDSVEFEGQVFPSMKTDKEYFLSKEAGINVTLLMNDPLETKPESVKKSLELCEKYGMYYLLHSNTIVKRANWHVQRDGSEGDEEACSLLTVERFKEFFDEYIHHPRCCGWYIWDEPLKVDMDYLGKIIRTWKDYLKEVKEEDKSYYVNLLAFTRWSGTTEETYGEYIKDAVEKAGVDYLSYDQYPFVHPAHLTQFIPEAKRGISPGVFNMACQIRRWAQTYDMPWHAFVQMGGNWTEEPDNVGVRRPIPPEILWEVNVFLAFGAKGIHYFTWSQTIAYTYLKYREVGGDTGAFDPYGHPTDLYWAAKKANTQIMAVDEYLMHAESTQIIIVGDLPTGVIEHPFGITTNTKYKELIDVEGVAVVGCFDYQGKTAFYVVYNEPSYACDTIKLTLDKTHTLTLVDRKNKKIVETNKLELQFEGGEGLLIIVEK